MLHGFSVHCVHQLTQIHSRKSKNHDGTTLPISLCFCQREKEKEKLNLKLKFYKLNCLHDQAIQTRHTRRFFGIILEKAVDLNFEFEYMN